jgi:hypothetical protein
MFFQLYHVTVLNHLRVDAWSEIDSVAEALANGASVTGDGHFLHWIDPAAPKTLFSVVCDTMVAQPAKDLVIYAYPLAVFHQQRMIRGTVHHVFEFEYDKSYEHPVVLGNFEDQDPESSTVTVASSKRLIAEIYELWQSPFSRIGDRCESAIYLSKSGTALQARIVETEFDLGNKIDVMVAGSFAIRGERRSSMVLGRSYTRHKKHHPTVVVTNVDEEYGPFKRVFPK